MNLIAVYDAVALIHHGDTHRGRVAQGLVEIAGAAKIIGLSARTR